MLPLRLARCIVQRGVPAARLGRAAYSPWQLATGGVFRGSEAISLRGFAKQSRVASKGKKNKPKPQEKETKVEANERIKVTGNVRLLDTDKKNLGEMSLTDAVAQARAKGLDLIPVTPPASSPRVCRIVNLQKHKEELKAKDPTTLYKERKRLEVRSNITPNDLVTKLKMAHRKIEKGHPLEIVVRSKQTADLEKDKALMEKIIEDFEGIAFQKNFNSTWRSRKLYLFPDPKLLGERLKEKTELKEEQKKAKKAPRPDSASEPSVDFTDL